MTRLEALTALKEAVEVGEFDAKDYVPARFNAFMRLAEDVLPLDVRFLQGKAWDAYNGSLDAARALVKETLPGFGYRVMECCVSDDASVFPDYSCPVHGERLKRELGEGDDWFALTDIDMRPPGKPARALLLSVLTALILIEERKT